MKKHLEIKTESQLKEVRSDINNILTAAINAVNCTAKTILSAYKERSAGLNETEAETNAAVAVTTGEFVNMLLKALKDTYCTAEEKLNDIDKNIQRSNLYSYLNNGMINIDKLFDELNPENLDI